MADAASAVRIAPDPLRKPWSEIARQREAATFGMWLFLMSEMLFFGALFMAFSFSRAFSPAAFMDGARHTEIAYGAANTVVLVTCSLTITLAVRAADIGRAKLAAILLGATAALGLLFLVIKGFEYRDDLRHHLFPGAGFALGQNAAQIFWAFYWAMTGIHAVHLAIGIGLVLRLFWLARRSGISPRSPQFEVTSLYWHLVDAFWLVLFSGSLRGGAPMSETATRALQWLGPLAAWLLILCGIAAVTCVGTGSPSERQSMAALALAAAMLLTLAFGLVGVGRNPALLRLVAGAAFLFLALMFLLSFADLLTRLN